MYVVGKVILDFRELFVVGSLGSDRGHFRDSALPRRSLEYWRVENPHICLNVGIVFNKSRIFVGKKNVVDVVYILGARKIVMDYDRL